MQLPVGEQQYFKTPGYSPWLLNGIPRTMKRLRAPQRKGTHGSVGEKHLSYPNSVFSGLVGIGCKASFFISCFCPSHG
jgi:hypothetical protein